MDTLKVPDKVDMRNLTAGNNSSIYSRGKGINAAADEIFSANRYSKQTRFGAADTNYEGSEKKAQQRRENAEKEEDDFIPRGLASLAEKPLRRDCRAHRVARTRAAPYPVKLPKRFHDAPS